MVHSKIQGFLWIMDIELSIKRRFSRSRDKGTNLMINTTLNLEDIWTSSIPINGFILIAFQRRHS